MKDHPNLLFILTDQQRHDTLGCYGGRGAHTPQLDALAARSTVFERAYCTEPICTPSRSALYTGLWPHTTGVTVNDRPLPVDAQTLAEMLPAGEWVCGYNGKWHLGDEIQAQHGFSDWTSVTDSYRDGYRRVEALGRFSDFHQYLLGEGLEPDYEFCGALTFRTSRTSRLPFIQTKPRFQAREAARFIREHRGGPFVLSVNFIEPH